MARRKFAKLKTAMYEAELTQDDLAKACERGKTYISRRLNAKEPFTTNDMKAIAGLLGLPREQWLDYFLDDAG